jgi:hypothetical protein
MVENTIGNTVTEAMIKAHQAKSVMKDRGLGVYGYEVHSPYRLAESSLEESIAILENIEGAKKQLAKVHTIFGDIAREAAGDLAHPKLIARIHYIKALEIFEATQNYDDVDSVAEKLVSLGRGDN